jgi:hypothetical protein
MEPVFAYELRDSICQRPMDSYLFVFFFGQSTGKVSRTFCILNMLDTLRESPILVPDVFISAFGIAPLFIEDECLFRDSDRPDPILTPFHHYSLSLSN